MAIGDRREDLGGEFFENLPALVQSNMILTTKTEVPIEDGDRFERSLPSGVLERFLILDAGFMQTFHGIPAHYQSKVHKETAIPEVVPSTPIVYNLVGPNTRVNIQSSDSSINVVNVEASALFDDLRKALSESIKDESLRQRIRETVDAMQTAVGTRSFVDRYKDLIGVAADHVSVLAPFLPALTQLLM